MNKTASRFLQRSGTSPSHVGLGPVFSMRVGRGDQYRNILKVHALLCKVGCTEAAIQRFWELSKGRLAATAAAHAIQEKMPELHCELMERASVRQRGRRVLPATFLRLLVEHARRTRHV